MHERERWQVIKAMLREQTLVRIADVCRVTGASEASVRRDFARLAELGSATRVRVSLARAPAGLRPSRRTWPASGDAKSFYPPLAFFVIPSAASAPSHIRRPT